MIAGRSFTKPRGIENEITRVAISLNLRSAPGARDKLLLRRRPPVTLLLLLLPPPSARRLVSSASTHRAINQSCFLQKRASRWPVQGTFYGSIHVYSTNIRHMRHGASAGRCGAFTRIAARQCAYSSEEGSSSEGSPWRCTRIELQRLGLMLRLNSTHGDNLIFTPRRLLMYKVLAFLITINNASRYEKCTTCRCAKNGETRRRVWLKDRKIATRFSQKRFSLLNHTLRIDGERQARGKRLHRLPRRRTFGNVSEMRPMLRCIKAPAVPNR